jgi:hypothetical protein
LTQDRIWIEQATFLAEATIDLLKGDNVGANFPDDLNDPIRPDATIRASAFMNIVRCNPHHDLGSDFVVYRYRQPRRCVAKPHEQPAAVDFSQSDQTRAARR